MSRARSSAPTDDVLPARAEVPTPIVDRVASATASIGDLVAELTAALTVSGIVEAGREARDIIAAILDVPRGWAGLHAADDAAARLVEQAREAVARRRRGMPFQYAVGRAAFRHLTLDVDTRVLIPRPETEGLVDLVLSRGGVGGTAVDVGTGSGAIALSLSHEGRFDRVIGTDLSTDALAVAAANLARLGANLRAPVQWLAGSYLAPVRALERRPLHVRAVVANPPYISLAEADDLPAAVRDWEPPIALFAAGDALGPTRAVIDEAADVLEPGGLLALEVDARRAARVAEYVLKNGHYVDVTVGFDVFGRDRFVTAVRRLGD
jgi:release factor glutamine methyltransferase